MLTCDWLYESRPERRPSGRDDAKRSAEDDESCKGVGEYAPKDKGDDGAEDEHPEAETPWVEAVGEEADSETTNDRSS